VTLVLALLLAGGLTGAYFYYAKPATFAAPAASASPEVLRPVLGQMSTKTVTAGLAAQLDPLVIASALGSKVNVSVLDLSSGAVLYDHGSANVTTPASNAKIVTAAAVLATRGSAYRITTKAVAGATPGEVVLVAAGDVTLAGDGEGYYAGAGQLTDLAAQIKTALGTTAPTKVTVDATLYEGPLLGPSWDADEHEQGYTSKIQPIMINGGRVDVKDRQMPFERQADPQLAAGQALARLLGLPDTAVALGTATVGTQELGAVHSAPMLRQLEQMLAESDNTLAEAMARQVALARNKPASFAGAAEAVEEVLIELGLPQAQATLADGAGYSRENKLSPIVLTRLLQLSADGQHPRIADLINVLPVAGWSGSMAGRFGELDATGARGLVRAKSGTLTGINSIAGVVETADGQFLAFAVLAEQVPTWQIPAQIALDRIVARIAACGCD
jgi:D-alanyl-D-alanine carboxypeptidase/D-alanyl-D-alanine-endopeptidase (penicillin-binding protein 4)